MNAQSIQTLVKKYPLPTICAAACMILFAVLYLRFDLISAQQEELDALSKKNSKQLANISGGARLDEQLAYLVDANKAVRARSLPVGGLAQNLQYFYKIESELGLKYSDVRPVAKPVAGKDAIYVPLAYTLSVETDFANTIALLRRLERGEFFCRINSLNASRSGGGVNLNVNLDLLGTP